MKWSVIQIFQHKLPQPSSARFVSILEDLVLDYDKIKIK